jgi:hypothetical protein
MRSWTSVPECRPRDADCGRVLPWRFPARRDTHRSARICSSPIQKVGDAAVFGVPNADLGEEVMPDPQPHITAVTRFPKVEMIP